MLYIGIDQNRLYLASVPRQSPDWSNTVRFYCRPGGPPGMGLSTKPEIAIGPLMLTLVAAGVHFKCEYLSACRHGCPADVCLKAKPNAKWGTQYPEGCPRRRLTTQDAPSPYEHGARVRPIGRNRDE